MFIQGKHMFDHSRTILICASLMLTAAPLASANAAGQQSVAVNSRDLNLTTERGRNLLRARIDHAVNHICGSSHVRSTWEVEAYANCSKLARASADAQFEARVAAAQSAQKMAGDGNDAAPVR